MSLQQVKYRRMDYDEYLDQLVLFAFTYLTRKSVWKRVISLSELLLRKQNKRLTEEEITQFFHQSGFNRYLHLNAYFLLKSRYPVSLWKAFLRLRNVWRKYGDEYLPLLMDSEIFISYSWDTKEHELKVIDFLNRLRKDGFPATIDKQLSADSSATNFMKMMHQAMQQHQWVIVILSAGYKAKADAFTGGAGKEYELLLSDIDRNPQKYILASFDGREDDVVPFGLRGRDVHDLNNEKEIESLHRKLLRQPEYAFAPVGTKRPEYKTTSVEEIRAQLAAEAKKEKIALADVTAEHRGSQSAGGLYRHIDYRLSIQLENVAGKTISDFAWELRVPKWLIENYHLREVDNGEVVLRGNVTTKFYAGTKINLPAVAIKLRMHEARQVEKNQLKLSVAGDDFSHEFTRPLNKVLRIRHPQYSSMGDVDFNSNYFAS